MSKSSEEDGSAGDSIALELAGGPSDFFSFGDLIATFRMCDEMNEEEFARVVGVSESYVRDVEACREVVSPAQAAAWARAVGYFETEFVRRLLQDQLDAAGLQMCVSVESV
jgi:transcriptional regulator with XRE-family HTH domain